MKYQEIIHIRVWYWYIIFIINYDMICHMMSFAWCYSHSHTCLECLCIRQNWWTGLAPWHVNKPTRSMSIDCSLLRDALSQPGRVTEAVLSLKLGRSGSPLHSVLFSTCLAQPVKRSFCDVLRFSYRMYRAVEASAVRCPRMGCCVKLCIWKIGKQQTADDGFWSLPAWSFMTLIGLIGGESHFSGVLTLGLFVFCLANGGACPSDIWVHYGPRWRGTGHATLVQTDLPIIILDLSVWGCLRVYIGWFVEATTSRLRDH